MVAYTFNVDSIAGMVRALDNEGGRRTVLIIGTTQADAADMLDAILGTGRLEVTRRTRSTGNARAELAGGTTIRTAASRSTSVRGMTAHLVIANPGAGGAAIRDARTALASTGGCVTWMNHAPTRPGTETTGTPTTTEDAHTQEGHPEGDALENPDTTT